MKNILVLANYDSPHLTPWIKIYEALSSFNIFFISNSYSSINKNFICLNKSKTYNPFVIRSIIKENKIDIVHTHSAGKLGVVSLLLNRPFIIRIYGSELFVTSNSFFKKIIMKLILHRASRIGASSKFTKDFIKRNFPKEYDKTSYFPFPASEVFKKINLDLDEKNYIFSKYIGKSVLKETSKIFFINRRVGALYNTIEVVNAFIKYNNKHQDAYLIIMNSFTSDTDYLSQLKIVLSNSEVSNNICFLDNKLNAIELNELYNISNLFISIPKTDQLSLSIMEGVKANCLPVLANSESYKYLIENYDFPHVTLGINLESNLIRLFNEMDGLVFDFNKFNSDFNKFEKVVKSLEKHFILTLSNNE